MKDKATSPEPKRAYCTEPDGCPWTACDCPLKTSSTEHQEKPTFTLDKLISILSDLRDKQNNGEYEVEFWLDDELIEIKSIGHFGVVPNTTMTFTQIR